MQVQPCHNCIQTPCLLVRIRRSGCDRYPERFSRQPSPTDAKPRQSMLKLSMILQGCCSTHKDCCSVASTLKYKLHLTIQWRRSDAAQTAAITKNVAWLTLCCGVPLTLSDSRDEKPFDLKFGMPQACRDKSESHNPLSASASKTLPGVPDQVVLGPPADLHHQTVRRPRPPKTYSSELSETQCFCLVHSFPRCYRQCYKSPLQSPLYCAMAHGTASKAGIDQVMYGSEWVSKRRSMS